jgi:hypothetical protein
MVEQLSRGISEVRGIVVSKTLVIETELIVLSRGILKLF